MYICFLCDDECGYYIKNRKNTKKQQALPSVFSLTLGKATIFYLLENRFAECNYLGTRRSLKLRRVPDDWHSAKIQTSRVPEAWHSAKIETSPSVVYLALGELWILAECHESSTRRSSAPIPSHPFRSPFGRPVSFFFAECGVAHRKNLPSAREKALGIAIFAGRRKAVCASPSATLGDFFAECFPAFAECLWHSAK